MWTSSTDGNYHGGYTYGIGPWVDAYRTADGNIIHRGYTYDPDHSAFTVDIPSMWPRISEEEWRKRVKLELNEEDEPTVNVHKLETHIPGERAVVCKDYEDLSTEHILTTLSVIKGKLMLDLMPYRIKKMECSITPEVKKNIINASKRLKMYGKDRPLVVHFDEWGNKLPDEITIGSHSGITLKIVNPDDVGDFYFELRATVLPETDSYCDSLDLPF